MSRALTLAVSALVLMAGATGVAQRPSFSGRWTLDKSKSSLTAEFGRIDHGVVVIDHREPSFTFRRSFTTAGVEDTTFFSLSADSVEVVRTSGPRTERERLYWTGDTLVYVTRIVIPQGQAINVVRYSLHDGGRELRAEERFRAPRRSYDNAWVFTRARR